MNRKTWSGKFRADVSGAGGWLLHSAEPPRIDVHLSGIDLPPDARDSFRDATFERIDIHWNDGCAEVTLSQGGSVRRLTARVAFVLEPQPELYRALPLQEFGAQSRAFWQRIFWLVRIPGGRLLLNFIARRARA